MKTNRITEAEWKVMEVVWEKGSLKASYIVSELKQQVEWNDKTIRTLVNRLVEKGFLGVEKKNVNVYHPLVEKEKCMWTETESFLEKIYNGSVGVLISNFVKKNKLTDKEIKDLKKLLEDKDDQK